MRIAVIPARGGSKRIPRKNIRPFCGRPMIEWSIRAARESGCFDRVIVSTDDAEIADVARACGAEVPFLRPAPLADDHAPTGPVIAHAIAETEREAAVSVLQACCIYATAPFVVSGDLRAGLLMLERAQADFAFSVTSYAYPIQRALRLTDGGQVAMFQPEHFFTRSQDLEEAWHDAGQFYWGTARAWASGQPIFGARSVPLRLPRHRVQDIDTAEDWERAEWMFRALGLSEEGGAA